MIHIIKTVIFEKKINMKILSTEQIRNVDSYTIHNKPISSLDLMESASRAFCDDFIKLYDNSFHVHTFCGVGNNGGDGLAISRILYQKGYEVSCYIIGNLDNQSTDNKINKLRLDSIGNILTLLENTIFEKIKNNKSVIVDAIFGSGLNKRPNKEILNLIRILNSLKVEIVSVDIASGLFADKFTDLNQGIIKPTFTISLEVPKLAFFIEENEMHVGNLILVDIGLSKEYISKTPTNFFFTTIKEINPLKRAKFGHKGTFGHAYLVAGSSGMMGAALLAGKACMRSGAGKLSLHVPTCGVEIIQGNFPEAITQKSDNQYYFNNNWENINLSIYQAVGIGPGISTSNKDGFKAFLEKINDKKCVLDADAINMISENRELLKLLPENTILTPHPKEFKNLMGNTWENDFEKLNLLSEFAIKYKLIVCLKGHRTAVALPNGEIHLNSTGNNGMATAGSGDVLTGIILGLLAQGYEPDQAAIHGVYEHGAAGDRAAKQRSARSIIASDIIENIL